MLYLFKGANAQGATRYNSTAQNTANLIYTGLLNGAMVQPNTQQIRWMEGFNISVNAMLPAKIMTLSVILEQ